MAGTTVQSRYKRYRALNTTFDKWIITTARKLANEKNDGLKVSEEPSAAQTLVLAQYINEAGPAADVPYKIIGILEEIIHLRSDVYDRYHTLAEDRPTLRSTDIVKQNETHRHYIVILKRVRVLLRPCVSSDDTKTPKDSRKNNPRQAAINAFDSLDLEEPSESPLGEAPDMTEVQAAVAKLSEIESEEAQKFDKELAIWCHFEDLTGIRQWARDLWKRFHAGSVSFLVASQLTEDAFGMLVDLHGDFVDAYPEFRGMSEIHRFLRIRVGQRSGRTYDFTSNLDHRKSGLDAADFFCTAGWATISDLQVMCAAKDDSSVSRHPSSLNRDHPFCNVLYSIEAELRALGSAMDEQYWPLRIRGLDVDWFTKALAVCASPLGRDVPAYMAAYCQIMFDIHDALGNDSKRASKVLYATAASCATSTNECMAFAALKPSFKPRITEVLDVLQTEVDFIEENRFDEPFSSAPDCVPRPLFEALPLLAASRTMFLLEHRYKSAMALANQIPATLEAAYLYKAAKVLDILKSRWSGMEHLVLSQSRRSPLIREASSAAGYARHFQMAMGTPISEFCRSPRPALPAPKVVYSKKKQFEITPARFRAASKVDGMSLYENKSRFYAELYFTVHDSTNDKIPQKEHVPLDILQALEKTLILDEKDLTFDFLPVVTQCLEFIYVNVSRLKDWTSHPTPWNIASEILWEAADFEQRRLRGNTKALLLSKLSVYLEEITSDRSHERTAYDIAEGAKPCEKWTWAAKVNSHHDLAKKGNLSPAEHAILWRAYDKLDDRKEEGRSKKYMRKHITAWANTEWQRIKSPLSVFEVRLDNGITAIQPWVPPKVALSIMLQTHPRDQNAVAERIASYDGRNPGDLKAAAEEVRQQCEMQ